MPEFGLRWRSFLVPKIGHAPDECEDAAAGDRDTGRFAVADGASESYAAGDWARLLVEAFVATGPASDWLTAPREAWQQETAGGAVSWYAEDKFARGGHTTFLGVSVQFTADGAEWEALAVGDSCLLHLRDGACAASFPLTRSTEFNGAPTLVNSRGGNPSWKMGRGTLRAGEALLLATDALAQHLLESAEAGSFAGPALLGLEEDDDFAMWVAMAREAGQLRNDDVALGVLELVNGE
ncbi:MAG TPA: protein phosphatase 2C domain-containing protein [Gemmataceae bacterium]|nr:protein phosphatase 2C domain-containing protein [Gemmataceae bacterium]